MAEIETQLSSSAQVPLPLQINFVSDTVFQTDEPAMKEALKKGRILCDLQGDLKNKLRLIKESQ